MGTGIANTRGINLTEEIKSKYSTRSAKEVEKDEVTSYMGFDDYLKLLVAQMQNQDFNDPMSDTEFLNQMATYSMIESIKNMTAQSSINQASSLIGKVVTVADGTVYDTGTVESVVISEGKAFLVINGTSHPMSALTDVVNEEKYANLSKLLGMEGIAKTTSGELATGKVTNVLIVAGVELVVLDGNIICTRGNFTPFEKEEEKKPESDKRVEEAKEADKTDDAGTGTADVDGVNGGEVILDDGTDGSDYLSDYSSVTEGVISRTSYAEKAQSILENVTSPMNSTSVWEVELSEMAEGGEFYVTYVDVPDYAAAIFGEDDATLDELYAELNEYMSSSDSSVTGVLHVNSAGTGNLASTNTGTLNSTGAGSLTSSGNAAWGQYTTDPGITTSHGIPKRTKHGDKFPAEMALAAQYGTRMYDIRHINNKAVTSRIKRGEIIGYSSGGTPVTEVGYSGVGRLGEVVTFANGQQRVEILNKLDGSSAWLHTSGNHTLDAICDLNRSAPLQPRLTPSEHAIRNYAIREARTGRAYGITINVS
ncbi:MAG: hypothetical protein FWG90_04140 [Oscillospiraceae bacterium]|nr:hypothetical protein [Oscillospiraceae bacterium]